MQFVVGFDILIDDHIRKAYLPIATVILFWIVSVVLIGLSLVVACGNLWITVGQIFKTRGTFESLIPFVGGAVGMVGMLTSPMVAMRHLWWLPLVVDLGCGPMLVAIVIDQIKKMLLSGRSPK